MLVVAGVAFIFLGATGDTAFEFFGQSFRSQNVGLAAIFLGGVAVVLLIRKVLTIVASREKRALRAASNGITMTNEVADQLASLVDQEGLRAREHSLMIEGTRDKIVADKQGKRLKTITANDLKSLPAALVDHIDVYEQALEGKYEAWKRLYPRRGESTVDSELRRLAASMRCDYEGILGFLESAGLELEDHYLHFADVIARA
jgi:hypothetical protein